MDLFEYQGKQYFAKYNIPVSAGGVAHTVEEAVTEAEKALYPVVVKAQVQVCLLYTSPSPRDRQKSRMPSSA